MHFNNPTQQKMKTKNMTTLHFKRSFGRSLSWRCGFVLVPLALASLALSAPLKAQDCPSTCPGGGNAALGVNALDSVVPGTGINNTAVGANALTSNTMGTYNVAIGSGALA